MSRTRKTKSKNGSRTPATLDRTAAIESSLVDAAFNAATRAAVDALTFGRSALSKTSVFFARGARKLGTLARALEESHA